MVEEKALTAEEVVPEDSNSEKEIPDEQQIMNLYKENMTDLADIKAMLTDFLEKQKKASDQEWISGRKVQHCLKISKSTLRRYRHSGLIRFLNINNTYRYYYRDLKRFGGE